MRRRTMLAAAFGAVSAYFLDPTQGRTRRSRAVAQLKSRVRKRRREAERRSRYNAKRVAGEVLAQHGAGRFHPVDDVSVQQHLNSVLARLDVPTSKVTIEVVDGLVRLRGQVEQREHEETVVLAVRGQAGVLDVESWLHLPGEVPPNKATALQAGTRAPAGMAPGVPPPS